jgi:molybdopterin converting factor subunit 1
MKVTVKLFAAARDAMAQSEVALEIDEHATVKNLRARLAEQFPPLRPILLQSLFAVDAQYVPDNTPLGENSEIAFIPPVSGG